MRECVRVREREREKARANERDVGSIHSLSVSMQMLYDVHLRKIHGNLGSDHCRNAPEHESASFVASSPSRICMMTPRVVNIAFDEVADFLSLPDPGPRGGTLRDWSLETA